MIGLVFANSCVILGWLGLVMYFSCWLVAWKRRIFRLLSSREIAPNKRKTSSSAIRISLTLQNLTKFIIRNAEEQFQKIRNRPFVVKRGFTRHSPNFHML